MNLIPLAWLACAPDPSCPPWYPDADGDGFGERYAPSERSCRGLEGWAPNPDDCDDGDPDVHPNAADACNGLDDNCDGVVDPEGQWYVDADGDGFGDDTRGPVACPQFLPPVGYAASAGDCDDVDPTAHPGAREACDGVDNDCDGVADDGWDIGGLSELTWADADGDGLGDPRVRALRCLDPSGWVDNFADCDDADALRTCPAPPIGVERSLEEVTDRIEAASGTFALGMSAVGDLDGDGRDDVVALAGPIDPVLTVYLGGWAGTISWGSGAVASVEGLPAGTFAVGAGDTNGDGRADLLVGLEDGAAVYRSPTEELGADAADLRIAPTFGAWARGIAHGDGEIALVGLDGRVWSFQATGTGVRSGADADLEVTGTYAEARIAAGDLDGDGLDELVLGDWNAGYETSVGAGAVWVLAPPWTGAVAVQDAATAVLRGEDALALAGQQVDASADADGDGTADLAIGSTRWAAVVTGTPAGDALVVEAADWLGTDPGFGVDAVVLAGDVDGDAAGDLAVAVRGVVVGAATRAEVVLVSGPFLGTASLDASPSWYGTGDGIALALAVGDLDGDGDGELLIGPPGPGAAIYAAGAP